VAGAVVDDSTLRGQRNRALLLMARLPDKLAVPENLQEYEASTNGFFL
jgi:hypothetical protein